MAALSSGANEKPNWHASRTPRNARSASYASVSRASLGVRSTRAWRSSMPCRHERCHQQQYQHQRHSMVGHVACLPRPILDYSRVEIVEERIDGKVSQHGIGARRRGDALEARTQSDADRQAGSHDLDLGHEPFARIAGSRCQCRDRADTRWRRRRACRAPGCS